MTKEIRHRFSLDRCEKIIDLYRNFELLRLKISKQCNNDCLEMSNTIRNYIYDITLPELNEYQKIIELRKKKKHL